MVSRLAITRLSLSDYRCYPRLKLETDARPVVLTGPNGAGKTNLLEAMSYLAPGRGLRGARLSEIDRHGGGGAWAVAAKILTPEGAFDIGAGRGGNDGIGEDGESDGAGAPAPDAARRRDRRIVRINGLAAPGPAALGEIVSLLWLTPSMDRLFSDGAGARRRFLDRLVFGVDPGHAGRLAAYDRAMRSRARLLRNAVGDQAWLSALEQSMAERGVAITAARREAAAAITRASADGAGLFPAAGLRVEGAPLEDWLDAGPALAAEERFKEALVASRAQDTETGGAAFGPHRSDLTVSAAATGTPAKICSTGEQKALLISIVLAGTRMQAAIRGAVPLLFLDEVTAHLDEGHRHALFEEISFLGVQAWLTGTDRSLFAALGDRAQYFDVADALVSPAGVPQ
ncbi:MAG: DNA replication/repair protein RecF [Proteobacteria bacterium]|nr:DNA replication/repair protein RecF [Pseudomonadota bacterium]